jgi:hypothetical protein
VRTLFFACAVTALLLQASPASACICTRLVGFDEVARNAPIVVIARTTTFGPPGVRIQWYEPVHAIAAQVRTLVKGRVRSMNLTVRAKHYWSSCGEELAFLPPGTLVAFALRPADKQFNATTDGPRGSDYFVAQSGCATSIKVFDRDSDAAEWRKRFDRGQIVSAK